MKTGNRTRNRPGLLFSFLAAIVALAPFPDAALGNVDMSAGFELTDSDSETENRITGETADSSTRVERQRYNLTFTRQIYPYLIFSGGGNFKLEDTEFESGGSSSTTERSTFRPYLELKLANPFVLTGIGYRNSIDDQKASSGQDTTRTRTTYYSFLSLQPEKWPDLDINYSRTSHDSDPETVKYIEDRLSAQSKYTHNELFTQYSFAQNRTRDRRNDFRTIFRNHSGKIQYDDTYRSGRVSLGAGYWFSLSDTDLEGTGSALVPKLRSAGLYSIDTTPEDGPALTTIAGLIDGDTNVPTSLDIGLAGDETTFTSPGVDLGFTSDIDTIRLWVHRELTPEVADSFTWAVYTSPDNTDTSTWQLHATVSPAPFGTFANRFEITFPQVNTRFIKLAVMPLLSSVPGASGFSNIFITEMEVFTTLTSQAGLSTLNQNLNLNLGWRISEQTSFGYDGYYRNQKTDPSGLEEDSLTNGIFAIHRFNEIFTGSARASRQDRDVSGRETVNTNYSAAMKANYLKTFRQTLTYSGSRSVDDQGDTSRTDGLFLRNNADLYRGVSAFLDTGLSWGRETDGTKSESELLRVGSKLVPNDKITFDLDYTANRSQISDGEERLKESGSFQTFIVPSQYLSMFARVRYDKDEGEKSTLQNYSINWSPSSGGSLQFFMSYDQRILSEGNVREENFSPGLRWKITRYAVLRTTYSRFTSDSDTELRNSQTVTANLKINL